MKKSLIAGAGVAAFGLAVLPVAGVFAEATPAGTITDTLNVNIPAACTIVNDNSSTGGNGTTNPALTNSYSVTMKNGQFKTDIGANGADGTSGSSNDNTINVSCNTPSGSSDAAAGWKLTVVGAGATGHLTDLYNSTANAAIATGTAESGATSNWAFKLVKDAGSVSQYVSPYTGGYAAVPGTEADIVTGSGSIESAFTMTYQVYVNQTQATGDYTGAVKYTLYNPAS